MEFFRRSLAHPSRLGILPGTFNPVTVAHLALAQAAASCVDEVLFVLPRVFPHKEYSGATFGERVELLCLALASFPHFSIAASDRGLFLDIADECRAVYGATVRLTFLCGRDAAERIRRCRRAVSFRPSLGVSCGATTAAPSAPHDAVLSPAMRSGRPRVVTM
jgi:nicotinic acid mononucleotide adenylyltransferase